MFLILRHCWRILRDWKGAAMMSPQSEGRPSTDRRPGENGYNNRGGYRQQSFEDNRNTQPGRANGYGQTDVPKQRFMDPPPAPGESRSPNGSLPHSPVDGCNGRSRETTQDLTIRERSRTNGAPGAKSSGTLRLCKKCGEALTGQFVRALGGTFHLDCFRCRVSTGTHPLRSKNLTMHAGLWGYRCFQILPCR